MIKTLITGILCMSGQVMAPQRLSPSTPPYSKSGPQKTTSPTILTGNITQNPGNIEAVSVPYPLFVPISGGDKKPTFFRVNVSML